MNGLKRLLANIAYSLGTQVFAKLTNAVLTIYIARELGDKAYGVYNFAVSFLALFSLLAEFGVSTLLTRQLAQSREGLNKYFVNSLVIKLLLSALMSVLVLGVVWAAGYDGFKKQIILLQLAATVVIAVNAVFIGVINGFLEMKYVAISTVVERIWTFSAGLLVLLSMGSAVGYMWMYLIGNVLQMFYLIWLTMKRYRLRLVFSELSRKFAYDFFKMAFPLGVTAYIIIFYYKVDIVMLGFMKSDTDIAYYSAAYMLINFLGFIPSAVMAVMFPALANLQRNQYEEFTKLTNHLLKLFVYIALPMSVTIFALAPKIIVLFFGEGYAPSILTLQILIWTISIMFFNSFLGNLQVIENRAVLNSVVVGITALVNVVLNVVLIPRYSFHGSAAATVISELMPALLIVSFHWYDAKLRVKVRDIATSLLGALGMLGTLYATNNLHFIVQTILGIAAYVLLLALLRAYSVAELKTFLSAVKPERRKEAA